MTTTLTLYPPPPSGPHHHDGAPHDPPIFQEPHISQITAIGKNALWVAFAIYVVANLLIALLTLRHEKRHRVFHYLAMLITGTAAISYFAMATNTGYSLVDIGVHFLDGVDRTVLRQVFWARFIGWAVISPLLLLTFCLLSGCPLIDAVAIMITDLTMIITASITMLTPGYRSSKWVWFIFTMVLFFYILGKLLWDCRKSAKMQSADTASLYNSLYIFTFIVWIMYPIFFVLGEITYTISCDLQSVAFTVLDLLAEAVFVVWLIFGHKYSSQHPSVLPEWSVEVRGAKRGQIHLQGDDPVGHVVPAPAPAPAPGHPAAEAHHV